MVHAGGSGFVVSGLDAYGGSRRALLEELEALDPATLAAKPRAGEWSILEIVEHLVLAERAVFRGLPDPSSLVARARGPAAHVRYFLVTVALKSPLAVDVPSPAMVPRGGLSLADLRRAWDDNRDWLLSCLEFLGPAGVRKAVFEHPVAGPLTVEQAIRLGRVHLERHIRQITALRRVSFARGA